LDSNLRTFSGGPAVLESRGAAIPHPPTDGAKRYFIVTAGRTGSTLLATMLADAGANFAIEAPADWDRNGGEMEHLDLLRASQLIQSAYTLSTRKPGWSVARLQWIVCRSRGRRRLREVLGKARFVKVGDAHWTIRTAFKMGYFPVVILSYRRFEDHAVSLGLMWDMSTVEMLADHYVRLYTRGLQMLNTFGGCAVSYESLIGTKTRSWSEPLSSVTGLPADGLRRSHQRRLGEVSPPVAGSIDNPLVDRIYEALGAVEGQVIPPSAQALRLWAER
jgi:hypothetical protein